MKILFSTTVRLGHLRPLLPFAVAAVAAGHQVVFAGPRSLAGRISRTGFEFLPFDELGPDELVALRRTATESSSRDAMIGPRLLTAHSAQAALPGMRAAVAAYRPDLVVRDVAELASSVVAQRLGIAEVQVIITLHRWIRELVGTSAPVLEQLSDHVLAPGGSTAISLLPESFDPVDGASVHRFRRSSPPARTRPTRPVVYVSYGSVTSSTEDGEALLRLTAAALADLPVSIVVSVDRSSVSSWPAYGTNVYPRHSPDEERVLARADVVVCHGGSGTTLSALRAGVPLLVVPQTCDQFAIAEATEATGVGLRAGHEQERGRPDPADLRSAVVRLLAEPSFRTRARAIADEIAAQPQAPGAVEMFERVAV